jgi:hypothetical protein
MERALTSPHRKGVRLSGTSAAKLNFRQTVSPEKSHTSKYNVMGLPAVLATTWYRRDIPDHRLAQESTGL